VQPVDGFRNGIDLLLEDDLLGRMLEGLTGEPATMSQRPVAAPIVDPSVQQQEG
jgi:hypothetical protein